MTLSRSRAFAAKSTRTGHPGGRRVLEAIRAPGGPFKIPTLRTASRSAPKSRGRSHAPFIRIVAGHEGSFLPEVRP
jgi:hypothetical protein